MRAEPEERRPRRGGPTRAEGLEPPSAWAWPQGPPRPLRDPRGPGRSLHLVSPAAGPDPVQGLKGLGPVHHPGPPCFGLRCGARPEAVKPERGVGVGN